MDNTQSSSSYNADKFIVRLPDGMRQRIGEVSKRARRSMNAEIVCRLEHSLNTVVDPIAAGEMKNILSRINPVRKLDLVDNTLVSEDSLSIYVNQQEKRLVESYRKLSSRKRHSILMLLS